MTGSQRLIALASACAAALAFASCSKPRGPNEICTDHGGVRSVSGTWVTQIVCNDGLYVEGD